MTRFIKLTSQIINTSHIIKIVKSHNKYCIYTTAYNMEGYIIGGFGGVDSDHCIDIYKNKEPLDYNNVANFVNSIPSEITHGPSNT